MTPAARATTRAALKADAAADERLDWLQQQRQTIPIDDGDASASPDQLPVVGAATAGPAGRELSQAALIQGPADQAPGEAARDGSCSALPRDSKPAAGPPLRLPHTDWLHHRLAVTGPANALADFQAAACGAGTIPWHLDGHRMEEDLFHLLVAPPAPQRRRLSLDGARALARQLREAAEERHAAAAARVGQSRTCPLDLHALVPVPPDMLQLGADHPDALAWLWTHWGTTDALRHVTVEPAPALRASPPPGTATVRIGFWSADWTPWHALAAARARWPALRFIVHPTYGLS